MKRPPGKRFPRHGKGSRCGGATHCAICAEDLNVWLDDLAKQLVDTAIEALAPDVLWTREAQEAARRECRAVLVDWVIRDGA